ncbi:type I-E CRISPR-associated protein Cse1/CasA [Streptomyces sp. NA04227]|uniref:type I-E CRISPR-associated protein Cse1/CasA n=1 Tax=Streptomyces sp. NA04227 TaxID=2742136 RepID=UPI0015903CE1|nr:type I-E CRISPR-associated protein Cse1/CasA [Streptomyces sp. NA04227]QKW07782.1 type I-E CRISPR-associated protein Cse1/CasA [Streptomyces sp. NA04227]
MPLTNLLDEPLFPVRWKPGSAPPLGTGPDGEVGLRLLLRHAHEIETLTVAVPPAHSALLRILYALTARATGLDEAPDGPDEWLLRRDRILEAGRLPSEGIDTYCTRHHDRFFLFDPGGRPWMQDPRLTEECDAAGTAGVNKLIVTRPAGNNHSWFTHAVDARPDLPSASDAVLSLLTWLFYGPSGKCSARTVNGTKTSNATGGPLRGTLSYHPEGATLFETLLAGLVPPQQHVRRDQDLCPWEQEALSDPEGPPPAATGPCSKLTGQGVHALLLVPDPDDASRVADAYITWGYRTGRTARPDDDYLIWQISQAGNPYPRHAVSSRALWRDLDALLLADPPGQARPRRPAVFDWAQEISEDLRVRALGFEQDSQAKDIQFVDAATPPLLGHLERRAATSRPAVGQLRVLGERFGQRLDRALRRAWRTYVNDPKDSADAWPESGAARYWPGAEREFWLRFARLDRTGTAPDGGLDVPAARAAFLRLALTSFDEVTSQVAGTQRGAKAVEEARIDLFGDRRAASAARASKTKEPTP